ncbi:MAG: HD domain-containing phosphohydrolase [Chloroflexia bacterium]
MAPIKRILRFRPNLISTFSVISFVLILVLGIGLALGIQQKVEDSAIRQQANHAVDLINLYVSPKIHPYELTQPWDINSPRFKELDDLIVTTLLRDHLVRVKLWSSEGTVLYSDQPQLVGETYPLDEDQLGALVGNVHTSITGLDSAKNEFERDQYDRLLEIYIPFRAAGEEDPGAVFEVYLDLDAVDALNGEVRSYTWMASGLGFVVLYASLFALVYKASRTLARQNTENAGLYKEASKRLAERLISERDLRDRVEFERLVMAVSTNFLNLDAQDIDKGVQQALRAVGTFVDADRCYVLRFDTSGRSTVLTHEWCAKGVVPMKSITPRRSLHALPWSFARMSEGETVNIPEVSRLPEAAHAERDFFTAMSSKSVLMVPMVYNRTLVGALGLDRVTIHGSKSEDEHDKEEVTDGLSTATLNLDSPVWSADSVSLIKIVSEILINALERKKAEDSIRESEQRFRAVFESAAIAIAVMDKNGRLIESNKAFQEMLGYSGDELKRMTFGDVTHPDDISVQINSRQELFEGKRTLYAIEKRYVKKNGETVWVNVLVSALRNAQGVPQLAIALVQDITEVKRSQEEISKQLERLNALRTIDNAITASFDLSQTLDVVLQQVTHQLKVDAADVLVLNQRTGTLDFAAGRGFGEDASSFVFGPSHSAFYMTLARRSALERTMIQIPDLSEHKSEIPTESSEDFRAYFALPLMSKGKVVGVLEIYNRSTLSPQPAWLHFMETLAGQTAIAVDNALLFQDLQRYNIELSLAYDTTLEGWSRALDLRDKETEGHTRRVTDMTVRLARTMGIDDATMVHIRRGALLHDIGKMGIPDAILLKPGSLTDAESEIMRLHPVYAYELLSPISFLRPSLDIPHYHHERWDGTGYPRGLAGEEIPLAARIFAVVDVYDALRSDRPYRTAWPEERVMQHIRSLSGTHFDPHVADAFQRMDRSAYRRTPTSPELLAEVFGLK